MWIAKSFLKLSAEEKGLYTNLYNLPSFPLSQTLSWAKAINKSGLECVFAYNPLDFTGGFAYLYKQNLEASNGPVFNDTQNPNEQLATFTYALTKAYKNEINIILRPKLRQEDFKKFETIWAFPIDATFNAKTLILDVTPTDFNFNRRIRHELKRVEKFKPEILIQDCSVETFFQFQKIHAEKKGYYLPERDWLENFLMGEDADKSFISHYLWRVEFRNSVAQAWFIKFKDTLYYFLSAQDVKADDPNISLSTYLIYAIIQKLKHENLQTFDFSGVSFGDQPHGDELKNIDAFKLKFSDQIRTYQNPQFIFTP